MSQEQARFNMVEQQIRPCEMFDSKLLAVLEVISREDFTQDSYVGVAYSDVAIPLPGGQKMLLPRVLAKLIQELAVTSNDKILEIGAGSGYVTAILAKMAEFVYALEINPVNKDFAVNNLAKLGLRNVSLVEGQGLDGLAKMAPFAKIFVGGATSAIPDSLKKQLKIGGILVGFISNGSVTHAIKITRISDNTFEEQLLFETEVEFLVGGKAEEFSF